MHVLDRRSEQYLRRERQVLQWLTDVLHPSQPPKDLYSYLMNGVTLCQLVEALRPNLIPDYHREISPGDAQKIRENVEMFREAIIRYGLPGAMVFEVADLTEMNNMSLVVSTLASLADIAQKREFPICMLEPKTSDTDIPLTNAQHTALRTMQKSVWSKRKIAVKRAPRIVIMSESIPTLQDVDHSPHSPVDGKDISPDVERGMIKLQALVRGFLTRKHIIAKQNKADAYRLRVVKEILETEQKYVDSLGACIEHFLDPLVGDDPEVPDIGRDSVRTIFSDIRIIHRFHKESILDVIRPRIEQWDNTQVLGDVFLRITGMMKIYTQYISNYSHSTQALAHLNQDVFWKTWRQQQEGKVKNMGLSSFLIMPVQRVPRYILLLSDLYKHTPRGHPDAPDLNDARLKMEKVTHFLNTKKKEAEKLEHLARLAEEFHQMGFNLAEPHRKFLREDTFGDNRVILCNDILVMVKPTRDYRTPSGSRIRNSSVPSLRAKQELIKGFPLEELLLDQTRTHFLIRRSSDSEILFSSSDIPAAEQSRWKEAFESVHTDAVDANSVATPRQSGQTPRNVKNLSSQRWDSIRRIRDQRSMLYSHMDAVDLKLQSCNKKERAQLLNIQKSFVDESQSLEKELNAKLAKQRAVKQRSDGSSILLRPAANPTRSSSV